MSSADQRQPGFPPGEYGRARPNPDQPYGTEAAEPYLPAAGYRPPQPGYEQPRPSYGQPPGYQSPVRQTYPPAGSHSSGPGAFGSRMPPPGPMTAPNPPTPPAPPISPALPGPSASPGPPAVPGQAAALGPRQGRSRTVAVLAALVLLAVLGWQAYQIVHLSGQVRDADRRLDQAVAADDARADGLDERVGALERDAGKVFNPEAISAAVLPSVFRVVAGPVSGTAFAVGKPASGGGTNLLTNWHVVEAVWESGQRRVFLERTGQRFPATIVKVDKEHDVAQLKADARFTGLVAASAPAKSGQQIVVVGAPLGLEDSVTTGVVSAQRSIPDLAGPVIQFDAPINPGNSGGPVVNGDKQVVGIATAKQRDAEGIGLAVPIKTACDAFPIC
ncbi:MAG TPA: S1C family serine protease [Micromonosporaceae bacterium]|nr:S1C family serine protease [Micromonosporaceae bacterium]